jgi:hypothetical protein
VIIELNPEYQSDFPQELQAQGIEMVGWIGLHGEPEYLRANINDRSRKDTGNELDSEVLDRKLDMANTIMQRLRDMEQDGIVTLFKVGWDNRATMGDEFASLVERMLADKSS